MASKKIFRGDILRVLLWRHFIPRLFGLEERTSRVEDKDDFMSPFILGTAQFGQAYGATNPRNPIPEGEVLELMQMAVENGVSTFDTAPHYGDSHRLLGKAIREGILHRPRVITKIRFPMGTPTREWAISQIERALEQLGLPQIDGLLLHNVDDFNREEVWDTLAELKERRLIHKVGVSAYRPADIAGCEHSTEIDLIQLPHHVLDHHWENEDWRGCLNRSAPPEIHVRSVFLQGLLLSKATEWPFGLNAHASLIDPFLSELSLRLECSLLELCIRYIRSIDWVSDIVVGIHNRRQMRETLAAVNTPPLPRETMEAIRRERPRLSPNLLDPRSWNASV